MMNASFANRKTSHSIFLSAPSMAQAFNRGRLPPPNNRLNEQKAPLLPYLFLIFYAILCVLMNTENLNPEQAKAVNMINGSALIIAGALLSSCTSVYNCSMTSFF